MPKNSATTRVAACTTEIFVAPLGTALPTASTAIAAPWTSVGIWNEDPTLGLEVDKENLKAPNSCATVRTIIKSREFTWQIVHAQWTKLSVEHYFGAGTWAASGTGERWTPAAALSVVEKALIFQMFDTIAGVTQELRILCPRVGFSPNGDIEFSSEELIGLPVEATVLAPAGGGAEIFIDANAALLAA
jgi:hypothetical protein